MVFQHFCFCGDILPNLVVVADVDTAFQRQTQCLVTEFNVSDQLDVRAVLSAKAALLSLGGHVRRINANVVTCRCVCYEQNKDSLKKFISDVARLYGDKVQQVGCTRRSEEAMDLKDAQSKFSVFCVSHAILSQIDQTEWSAEPEENDGLSVRASSSVRGADHTI
jgi:hypothetical protein